MLHGCMGVFVVLTLVNGQQNQYWTKLSSSIHPHPSRVGGIKNQTNEPPPADTRPAHIHSNTDDMLFSFFQKVERFFVENIILFSRKAIALLFFYLPSTYTRESETDMDR
jgi:hypothetical protein